MEATSSRDSLAAMSLEELEKLWQSVKFEVNS